MSEEKKEQAVAAEAEVKTEAKADAPAGADASPAKTTQRRSFKGGARRGGSGRPGGFRKGSRFGSRPKPEFEQKIINISRVTRVVKGGRRLSFRVDMVIGDKKGRVGLGTGKATDTSLAIQKAFNQARKNLLYLKLTKNNSIPHEVEAKVTSSQVHMMPNKERGLVVGSTMRNVLEFAGITDVTGRVMTRSKNKLNIAKATIEALRTFDLPISERPKPKAPQSEERRGFRGGRDRRSRAPRRTTKQV
jgi:small subunit ribosomal protein S5